ncbi:hypothetical protein RBH26_16700 [Natronolimnohabitans sp. A-GB9]|uniref:hypothetical protein n=1 Tax=Natronolimnohabitans sp. A-GB9 TaxID=3069757 RepID=UPI0027B4AFB9|nr:hypothetical protein [Natronolimnohabitans sp. A-GB9]MDQ2052119.1 hypothetical protein [Natronolimnohabitans sp. A-GB9]
MEYEATDHDAEPDEGRTATATITATRTRRDGTAEPANVVTIIGHETPSSFEITVDGEIDVLEAERSATSTVVSGSTVEGTIESDTIRFAFTGELTDITFVDRQITGVSPATAPNVHVDYAAPEQS